MTVPALSLNFLPGFSHSALPLRAVLWMTSLKAHHCFHLPVREMTAYSSPLGNQVYLPRKSLFFSALYWSLCKILCKLVGSPFVPPLGREMHVHAHLGKKAGDFQALIAHFFWVTFSIGQGDSLSSSIKGCFKVASISFSTGLIYPFSLKMFQSFESLDFSC